MHLLFNELYSNLEQKDVIVNLNYFFYFKIERNISNSDEKGRGLVGHRSKASSGPIEGLRVHQTSSRTQNQERLSVTFKERHRRRQRDVFSADASRRVVDVDGRRFSTRRGLGIEIGSRHDVDPVGRIEKRQNKPKSVRYLFAQQSKFNGELKRRRYSSTKNYLSLIKTKHSINVSW